MTKTYIYTLNTTVLYFINFLIKNAHNITVHPITQGVYILCTTVYIILYQVYTLLYKTVYT